MTKLRNDFNAASCNELDRPKSSGKHYAVFGRGGKQFRRSLKTRDRKLADRRLNALRVKIGCLKISDDAKFNFEKVAKLWLETQKHVLSSSTVKRREMYIKGLAPNFGNSTIRNTPTKLDVRR